MKHWKIAAGLAASVTLAGCSSSGNLTYRAYGQALAQAFSFSKTSITRQQAASVPYASMGYRIDNGNQFLLVLATDNGGQQLWTSANRVVFQTSDGRITRTVGLPHNLGGMSPHSATALPPPAQALKTPFTSIRLADFPERGIYSAQISCSAIARRPENIAILGQTIATVRVDETCENRSMNWQFVDSYWLAADTGMVWRSVQHISPESDAIEIEILRPPG